jgi:hypothetical protein
MARLPRIKTWRVRKNIRALLSAAEHDRGLVIQWIDEELATPSKIGRSRMDYFYGFTKEETTWTDKDGKPIENPGFYTVRFHVRNAAEQFVVLVRKDRKAAPTHAKTMTLHAAMQAAAKYALKYLPQNPHRNFEATAAWLEREVRKKLKDTDKSGGQFNL